jgi:hypothetical protein
MRLPNLRGGHLAAFAVAATTCNTPTVSFARDSNYDNLFQKYGNSAAAGAWGGADSSYSTKIDGSSLWFFSDTLTGPINNTSFPPTYGTGAGFIHNSVVYTKDNGSNGNATAPYAASLGSSSAGFIPAMGSGAWSWLSAPETGTINGTNFLWDFTREVGSSGSIVGTGIESYLVGTNSNGTPNLVGADASDLTASLGGTVLWGVSIWEDPSSSSDGFGGFDYVYGSNIADQNSSTFTPIRAYVARTPINQLNDPPMWTFWNGSGWSSSPSAAAPLNTTGVDPQFSVVKERHTWFLFSMNGADPFSRISKITYYYSCAGPAGPWTGPATNEYATPETNGNLSACTANGQFNCSISGSATYGVAPHPEFNVGLNNVLFSYNVNFLDSNSLQENLADADVYRPRFIDVKITGES